VHEFGAASKRKFGKKEEEEKVISDMFPRLFFVFAVFSRSQMARSKGSPGCGVLFAWLAGTPSG